MAKDQAATSLRQMLIDSGFFMDIGGERTLRHVGKDGSVSLTFDPFDGLTGVNVSASAATKTSLTDDQRREIDDALSEARDAVRRAESAAEDARSALDDIERIETDLRDDG